MLLCGRGGGGLAPALSLSGAPGGHLPKTVSISKILKGLGSILSAADISATNLAIAAEKLSV